MDKNQLFENLGGKCDGALRSQLFGKPCFKINGKAFMCLFQDEFVFKLNSDAHKIALSYDGSKLFDPSGKGRPMKEWVQVSFDNLSQLEEFTFASFVFVKNLK